MAYFRIPVDFVHEQESKTLKFDLQSPLKIEILQTRHSLQIVHGDLIFLDILGSFFYNTKFTDFCRFNKIRGICKLNLLIVSEYGYKKSFKFLHIHEELTRQGVGVTAYILI